MSTTPPTTTYSGGCRCGSVRYEATATIRRVPLASRRLAHAAPATSPVVR